MSFVLMQEKKKGINIISNNQECPLHWEDAACFGLRDWIKDFNQLHLKLPKAVKSPPNAASSSRAQSFY